MIKTKCLHCGKIIEGYTKKHINAMLKIHITSKHPEKVVIDMGKKKNGR